MDAEEERRLQNANCLKLPYQSYISERIKTNSVLLMKMRHSTSSGMSTQHHKRVIISRRPSTMLTKPRPLQLEHHQHIKQQDKRRVATSRDTSRGLLQRRHFGHLKRLHERVVSRRSGTSLPLIIATGPGHVWRRSAADKMIYQDTNSPNRLLHVIPDDDEGKAEEALSITAAATDAAPAAATRALRHPGPLPYVGRPMPVAPTLLPAPRPSQQSRYLVRPRFPVNIK